MKSFWILWTYIANYGGPVEVKAYSADQAATTFASNMSGDFQVKGTVFVFDTPPASVLRKGEFVRELPTYGF